MAKTADIRALTRTCIKEITQTLIAERKNQILPEFSLDEFQQRLIDTKAGFVRLVAPAGSGKTRTLIAKGVQVLSANHASRVLCLTFTNAAADEFRERSSKLHSSIASRLKVSTLNSFGWSILRSGTKPLRIVTSSNPAGAYSVIKAAMPLSPIWNGKTQPSLYGPILELTDLMKSLGFDHTDDQEAAIQQYEWIDALGMLPLLQNMMAECEIEGEQQTSLIEMWFPFWQRLCTELWSANLITLEDQKYWALNQLATQNASQQWLHNKQFSYVLVDEFQDINILDLFLIAQIVHLTKASLIIVGDDDQCIYEWRGCISLFIQQPDVFFQSITGGAGFKSVLLERNYRCPRNIVVHSRHLINHNHRRISKEMCPVRTDNANIRIVPLPAAYMTINVVDELVGFLAEKHPKHSVAIVGRKKCQLIPIQILLTRRGTKFSIDTDLNIFEGNAFQEFRKFLELPGAYTASRAYSRNVEDLLLLLKRTHRYPVSKREHQEVQKWLNAKKPRSLQEAVQLFANYPGKLKGGYVAPSDVTSKLQSFLSSNSVVACLHIASHVFKGFQKDFVKSKEDIFYSDPPFSHLADLAVNYGSDFGSFLYDIDRAIERAASRDPRGAKIELMTALRTKGREFDTVIVLDVNDGIWPNKLSQDAGRLEEERRLFYVTITRTKNNLLLFESGRVQGQQMSESPFLQEMQLPASAWLSNPQLERISRDLLAQLKI
jgi:DNA helicase II / ATP-dependent DNA helicase PcrA